MSGFLSLLSFLSLSLFSSVSSPPPSELPHQYIVFLSLSVSLTPSLSQHGSQHPDSELTAAAELEHRDYMLLRPSELL